MPTIAEQRTKAEPASGAKRPSVKVEAFLSRLPLFSELETGELARLVAATHTLRIPKGAAVFNRGDPCTGFHVAVYGQVKLAFVSSQGVEKVVQIVGPGESFGEALMFLERPYIVAAHALTDCMLLHVSRQAVFDGIEADPRFARRMLSGLSLRLHGLVHDVEAYSLRSSVERVIGFLLSACTDAAQGGGGECVVLSAGKGVIASRLNMTPEHFSRVLHDLAAESLIDVDGRCVVIRDIDRLKKRRASGHDQGRGA